MSSNFSEKGTLSIIRTTVDDAIREYPEIGGMMESYAAEAMAPELGTYSVQLDHYRNCEAAGIGQAFVAVRNGALDGLMFMLISRVPHHDKPIAVIESIYSRHAGQALIAAAKEYAREREAKALYINAPTGGRLERRMQRDRNARQAASVFVWAL